VPTERHRREALGLALLALGVLLALAVLPSPWVSESGNLVGPAGSWIRDLLVRLFGVPGFLVVAIPVVWALHLFDLVPRGTGVRWSIFAVGGLLLLPPLLRIVVEEGPGGRVGEGVAEPLASAFGPIGAGLILGSALLALSVLTLGWSPREWAASLGRAGRKISGLARGLAAGARGLSDRMRSAAARGRDGPSSSPTRGTAAADRSEPAGAEGGVAREIDGAVEAAGTGGASGDGRTAAGLEDPGDLSHTELPPLDLLTLPERESRGLDDAELAELGQVLIDKLESFRVEGEIQGWTTGPVVTQFEVVPASGVKVGQIAARSDDLALAMKAPSVRIVAPIPGKGAVGVEVPNPEPEIVHLREILESSVYRRSRAELPLALGRDLAGAPYCTDLTRMPHLLIAGATGSGKSVCINTIITSLVYRYTPRELRLLMVDPKMVELSVYDDLPHLRHPVVTDNEEAASVLKWARHEMNRRYELLSANGARSLREFNRRVEEGREMRRPGDAEEPYEGGRLPYVVLLIDELADLMMTVQAEVEGPLAMLAQKARAVGIHLVIATQRPSVNVITGLIKANFPSRIAFRVASKTDSRTILDQNGAESLLGNGDMLFLPPGEADPVRIQGAFVGSRDTDRLVAWYRERMGVERPEGWETGGEEDILEVVEELEKEEERVDIVEEVLEDRDELFRQAAEVVIANDSGSTSLLQRRLRIGYGRAARIIDQLHHAGIVGPSEGSQPREVLVEMEELDRVLAGRAETPDGSEPAGAAAGRDGTDGEEETRGTKA